MVRTNQITRLFAGWIVWGNDGDGPPDRRRWLIGHTGRPAFCRGLVKRFDDSLAKPLIASAGGVEKSRTLPGRQLRCCIENGLLPISCLVHGGTWVEIR